jgi:hypothetical protein
VIQRNAGILEQRQPRRLTAVLRSLEVAEIPSDDAYELATVAHIEVGDRLLARLLTAIRV